MSMTGTKIEDNGESLHVVLEVPDHETLVSVLNSVSETEGSVRTENITTSTLSADASVTINLGELTDKQREALNLAVEYGYYDQPRDATLADLASELDISKSAVSQRLRSAETKLVKHALNRYR